MLLLMLLLNVDDDDDDDDDNADVNDYRYKLNQQILIVW